MKGYRKALAWGALLVAGHALAQAAPPAEGVQLHVDAGLQLIHERNPFWGLAEQFAPSADYQPSYGWAEGFVKPSVQFTHPLQGGQVVYGTASALASYTARDDIFLQGNTGRVLLEDAFLGLRQPRSETQWGYDLSVGAQPYRLGQGFLLSNGAGNGFERGAAVSAPRKAWGLAALGRLQGTAWSADAFYLDPNELRSGNTGTRIAGVNAAWSPGADASVGLAYFKVLESTAPYPQAPVRIIDGGREGLQTLDLHWRFEPKEGPLAGFSAMGELALQRNARVQMQARGLGMELGYRWAGAPLAPRLSYSARYFSGDDPSTPHRLERFDALFYDGGPATWSSGGNGSFAFYNANLMVHRVRLDLTVSPQDFVNLSYWNIHAAQANSPLQYGQAGRLAIANGQIGLISGVPRRALSQELYLEHTRVLSQHLFFTWGVALAFPQEGIKAVLPAGARRWTGVLANLSYRY